MNPRTFTIREAAERIGVSAHTLRYYERIGLLARVGRGANGHRRFTGHDLGQAHLLNLLRQSGMSIQQMQAFVRLERQGQAGVAAQCALLESHHAALQARIAGLQQHLAALEGKIAYYRGLTAESVPKDLSRAAPAPPNGQRRPRRR